MSMQDVAGPSRPAVDVTRLLASRWLWCLVALGYILFRDLTQGFSELLTLLGDTDDATRLTQVRTLMATGAWFDMTLPRIGGAEPLMSHWSRLIDVPLIVLLRGFGLVVAPATAELLTRIVWPMLLLLVFLRVLVRAAEAQSGSTAGWLLLVLAVTCLSGLIQFRIGRIDHHNAMILGSVGGLLVLLDARRRPEAGTFAGVLLGLGLSVGYEPLVNVLPALGVAALWAIWDMTWLPGVRRMLGAMAATMAGVLLATVAPWQLLAVRCDALSLNMVVLVAAGAAGLAVVDRDGRGWSFAGRLTTLAVAGAIGAGLFGVLDTRCLAGPFGQTDPALHGIWLDHVLEAMTALTLAKTAPAAVIGFVGLMLCGLGCAADRWRRLRTPETLGLLVLMALTAPTGLWMIKMMPYASWIAVFAMALWIADLGASARLTALTRRLAAALVFNQLVFTVVAGFAISLVGAAPSESAKADAAAKDVVCTTTPAVSPLSALPKGLFVAPIDFGSYLVALTQHDALAAPYHRADQAIIANHRILTAEPAEARRRLHDIGADYLALCLTTADLTAAAAGAAPPQSGDIVHRLRAGARLDFLEAVTVEGTVANLKVWRVVR